MTHRERPAESHTDAPRGELFYVGLALVFIVFCSYASYFF